MFSSVFPLVVFLPFLSQELRSARVVSAEWAVAFYNLACLRLRIAWNIARGHARDHGLHALPLYRHVVFFEAALFVFFPVDNRFGPSRIFRATQAM